MNYELLKNSTLTDSDCLILGLFSDLPFSEFVDALDQKYFGLFSRLVKHIPEEGNSIWQGDLENVQLMLINCGKEEEFCAKNLLHRLQDIANAITKKTIKSLTIHLPQIKERDPDWQLEYMLLQLDSLFHPPLSFKQLHTKKNAVEEIKFYLPNASSTSLEAAKAIAAGTSYARTLADMPANICTPTYLAEQALKLTQEHDHISARILGPEEMQAMGMGALLAVAQGSNQEPRLIEVSYCGKKDSPPIVLVGKGITFDSGGLSIKPGNAMDEMKYDMSGAASVLGTLKASVMLNLPIHLIGLIASAENMLSGSALKPGDVITSMSGKSIEVLNTDAEGRLVLADALTYAEQFKPAFVIDIATLTGAMVVALGHIASGFMTEDEELAEQIIAAANATGDKAWRMPLDEEYQTALESPIADMINAAFDRAAGAITAACFLSRFTKKYRWAHLDIAGTAWVSGKKRHATGRPVPLLTQLLRHVACTS